MEPNPSQPLSFVVRIWLEELPDHRTKASWRGHITNVLTGERRYISRLHEIDMFITAHLEQIGIAPALHIRLLRWLRHHLTRQNSANLESKNG